VAAHTDEYARFAAYYDALLNPFLDRVRERVARICRGHGAARVVDVCCGTARQAVFLQRHGIACVGADLSFSMLKAGAGPDKSVCEQTNARACPGPDTRTPGRAAAGEPARDGAGSGNRPSGLVLADAVRLPFADNAFDAALLSFALHEKPQDTALTIVVEALRVAPLCIITDYTMAERNLELPGQWLMAVPERLVGGEHWRNYRVFMQSGAVQGLLHRISGVRLLHRESLFMGGAGIFVLERAAGQVHTLR